MLHLSQLIYVCNSERIIKIWQYLQKLCSNEKGSKFFDSVYNPAGIPGLQIPQSRIEKMDPGLQSLVLGAENLTRAAL